MSDERQGVERVYLVEVSDDLIESWLPLGVYLHKEMAEDCAEMLRREEDGVRQFARVVELNVEDASPEQAIAATLADADATGERQRDAVEVVRCRDCERFAVDQSDHDYRTGWWCKRWDTDMVKPDGFCCWGNRKEDA